MNKIFKILGALLVIGGIVLVLRFTIGGKEDTWICQNGEWVKHGNPSESKPIINCEEGEKMLKETQQPEGKAVSQEESREIALAFAKGTSTYKYDGEKLELRETETLLCPSCYAFGFHYQSRHAGYGDRKGQMTASVITPHNLEISVKEGKVTSAVVDGRYDELLARFVK